MAAEVADGLAASREVVTVGGEAAEHARRAAQVAYRTLDELATEGWRAILGSGVAVDRTHRLGADAVAERVGAADPLATRTTH